ncbi:RNA-directed DNA polymerase, eukaryota [Tanacetum coccineum]
MFWVEGLNVLAITIVADLADVKVGGWGGDGGSGEWEFPFPAGSNLSKIQVISNAECIVSVMFTTYSPQGGQHNSKKHGGAGVKGPGILTHNIQLGFGELVSEIRGTYAVYQTVTVITSLTFVVGTQENGPYGKVNGTAFSLPIIDGHLIQCSATHNVVGIGRFQLTTGNMKFAGHRERVRIGTKYSFYGYGTRFFTQSMDNIFINLLTEQFVKGNFTREVLCRDKKISVAGKMAQPSLITSFRRNTRSGTEASQMDMLTSLLEGICLPNMLDRWCWSLSGDEEFSVSSARILIDDKTLGTVGSKTHWCKYVPLKVNILSWRVKLNNLPTRLNLSRRGLDGSRFSSGGGEVVGGTLVGGQVSGNYVIKWGLSARAFNTALHAGWRVGKTKCRSISSQDAECGAGVLRDDLRQARCCPKQVPTEGYCGGGDEPSIQSPIDSTLYPPVFMGVGLLFSITTEKCKRKHKFWAAGDGQG